MICFYCGRQIPDGSVKCPYCEEAKIAAKERQPPNEKFADTKPENSDLKSTDPIEKIQSKIANDKNLQRRLVILGSLLIAAFLAYISINTYVGWKYSPNRATETGTYPLTLSETIEFPSIQTSVTFEEAYTGNPNYDNLSVPIDFIFRVTFPNSNSAKNYHDCLSNFNINGEEVQCDIGYYDLNLREVLHESSQQGHLDYLQYRIPYTATYDEHNCKITCKVNENINIDANFQYSFWDFDGVDKEYAIGYKQNQLDQEYGITAVDWKDDANSLEYVKDQPYKMTGEILSCGKYVGNLTDKYYITLDAVWAFPGVDVHCYFSESEWHNAPNVSSGDTVTFYGYYDYWSFGWDFRDCSFESPAGTFEIDGLTASTFPPKNGSQLTIIPPNSNDNTTGDVPDDLSYFEGEYHMAHNYTVQMDLWFPFDASGVSWKSWQGSEPTEVYFNFSDGNDYIGSGTAYWYPPDSEYPEFDGYFDNMPLEISMNYDGYNFIVNCPELDFYDASFFYDE